MLLPLTLSPLVFLIQSQWRGKFKQHQLNASPTYQAIAIVLLLGYSCFKTMYHVLLTFFVFYRQNNSSLKELTDRTLNGISIASMFT